MSEEQQLRAELEALYRYVEERDQLVVERDALAGRLHDAHRRIAELTYQRDRISWRFESLKGRRFMRVVQVIVAALREPRRLLRLPVDVTRAILTPTRRLPEPLRPDPSALPAAAGDRAPADVRDDAELQRRYLAASPARGLDDLRVAAILDTFSTSCFAPECELITFRPDNWQATLETRPPHLLLVESAWQGNDGAWQYQVGSYSYPDSIGLPPLSALVEWCRQHNVPTVFWNKEDPVHFDKFKEAAQLFDVVLTTDADRVDAYRSLPGLRAHTVAPLPFAAQPSIHNPVLAPAERTAAPVFAGTYYRNRHTERKAQLEMLLDAAVPFGLRIYDRMHGKESESVGYPERFAGHISGGLPYDEMVEAYKTSRVFLNTNSVTESPTMFSRRVFELLASGTPVVSTPSLGMQQMFGDVLDVVSDPMEATAAITDLLEDDELWHRRSRAGISAVMRGHTYEHRLATIARHAGFDVQAAQPDTSLVVLGGDEPHLFRQIHDLAEQGDLREILQGVTASSTPTPHPSVTRVVQQAGETERDRLRDLAQRAGSDWLLVLAGPDEFTVDRLDDLRAALRYTDASVIGSAVTGPPHRYVTALHPSPVLIRRDVVARHGWGREADAAEHVQSELVARGHRLFATDIPSR